VGELGHVVRAEGHGEECVGEQLQVASDRVSVHEAWRGEIENTP
jgi:hypothetical protein